jgi:SAM-dependent methyltransferase
MTRDTLDYRFDQRVADQYDALRGHPPAVARQVGVALAAALGGCGHVLHLVDSRTVLQSLLRLLRPGGSILLGRDWVDPDSFAGQLRNAFRQAVVDLADSVDFPAGGSGMCSR